jgi:hypothetical protein
MAIKKGKLTVVEPTPLTSKSPPPSLGDAGRSLWDAVVTEYEIRDSSGLTMLAHACAAADRIAECAEAIRRDGPMLMTKHGPKEHPLLKVELAQRAFLTRTLARLNLDVEPVKSPGRPGGGIGWIPPT